MVIIGQAISQSDIILNDLRFEQINSLIRNFSEICWLTVNLAIAWYIVWISMMVRSFPGMSTMIYRPDKLHLHYESIFQQSLILEDPEEGNGRFLLDVGSAITVKFMGTAVCDARFIDINSGPYTLTSRDLALVPMKL